MVPEINSALAVARLPRISITSARHFAPLRVGRLTRLGRLTCVMLNCESALKKKVI